MLFIKFNPLPQGNLRSKIENLASEINFPLKQIYLVESTRLTMHSNAFLIGLFKKENIVLFDSVSDQIHGTSCNEDEIVAIVCHELGHWYHMHIINYLILSQSELFIWFLIFSTLFKNPVIYTAFGFYTSEPVLVGLFIVINYVLIPYHKVFRFISIYFSRKMEYEADEFVLEIGKGDDLKNALLRISKENLNFPCNDFLFSVYFNSHPTLLERLIAIENKCKN